MDFSFILKWILPLNLISTLFYFQSFFFLSFAVTFHFTFSLISFFLLFNLRKTKNSEWQPSATIQIFYFSSLLRTRKNNGFATRMLWAFFVCVKLIVYVFVLYCFEHFFLNRSCIFTSSKHRNTSMVWNLRQTIFCFGRHMWINTSQRIIYLWYFYLF